MAKEGKTWENSDSKASPLREMVRSTYRHRPAFYNLYKSLLPGQSLAREGRDITNGIDEGLKELEALYRDIDWWHAKSEEQAADLKKYKEDLRTVLTLGKKDD